jgi:hypothetical protein
MLHHLTADRGWDFVKLGLLSNEEWLSKVFCFSSKLWLMSDDEDFHLPNSEGDEPF